MVFEYTCVALIETYWRIDVAPTIGATGTEKLAAAGLLITPDWPRTTAPPAKASATFFLGVTRRLSTRPDRSIRLC
jgi:hypothetical protein